MNYETSACAQARPVPGGHNVAPAAAQEFLLQGALRPLSTGGCRRRLPPGPTATLAERVSGFFAESVDRSRPLVGLLPFNPHDDDALYQPQELLQTPLSPVRGTPRRTNRVVLQPEPPTDRWAELVAHCITRLAPRDDDMRSALHKVVLARSLQAQTDTAVDIRQLVQRLAGDPDVVVYCAPIPVAKHEPPAWLVGATPELLVSRRGNQVVSNPLAGSARRSADAAADDRTAQALLASSKDQDEHRYVVEAITDALAPLCDELRVPPKPSLQATRTMWHLGTRIEGRLKNRDISAARLAAALHPTPAVCGTPPDKALATIQSLEPIDRGFYAGAVGWVDTAGDGDWYLSLRCARVQGRSLRLFAGAGLVANSLPALEVMETIAKFQAMLNALGIDDTNCSQLDD